MNRVTELLKVNQTLRDENNEKDQLIRKANIETYNIKEESEDLWERIELLEQIVSSNDELFRSYISKFMKPNLEMSNLDQGHLILRIDAMC